MKQLLNRLDQRIKRLTFLDIVFIKFSSFAGILFLLKVWSPAMKLVQLTNPIVFLAIFIVFVTRPFRKIYFQ